MTDITQRFSIDVSQAISALDTLDARLKEFNASVSKVARGLKAFNKIGEKSFRLDAGATSIKKATVKIKAIVPPLKQAEGALSRFGKIGKAAFKGLFGSTKGLLKLFGTLSLVQGFFALQSAIFSSVTAASELSKKIREVGTILPTTQRNADALAQSVRRLSDTFNLPISVVTEGLYQTISNQIGDAATSIEFLTSAAKFAKTSVTDVDTAVNLLSGTINAFGLAASDADAVADKLFKTIELGRTRASELANSLGRILPVASELGVSLDEVLAGFATVTIAGIKTSEATTQLRGAFNAILKPTTALKELLAELGFESGEAFVQALGLQGAFSAIREAAGGSIQELSKFIPRVRGLNSVLILAGSGADKFQDNLQKIRDEANSIVDQNFEFVIESNAEKVANTVNRLKNLFTTGLGNSILETLAKFTIFVGELDQAGAALKTIAAITITAGVGVGALAVGVGALSAGLFIFKNVAAAASGAALTLGVSVGALASVVALALAPLAVFAALRFAENSHIALIQTEIAAVKDRNRQELAFEAKQNAAKRALRDVELRELNSVIQEQIAAFNKGYQERVSIAKKANDEIIKDQKRIVDSVVKAGEAIIAETQKRVDTEQSIQKDSIKAQADATKELSDFDFAATNKNFDQLRQFSNLQERSNQQRRDAATLANQATGAASTQDDIDAARAALERSQATAEEARTIATSIGDRRSIAKIEDTIRDILKQKVRLEQDITRASQYRESVEKARIARQKLELGNIKALAQEVLNAPSLFDDKGDPLTGDAQAKALKERQTALVNFRRALGSSKELSIDQIINFSQLSKNLDNQISKVDLQNLSVNSAAFVAVRNQINQNLAGFRAEFGGLLTTIEIAQDLKITNPGELSTALSQQVKLDQNALQVDDTLAEKISEVTKEARLLKKSISQVPPIQRSGYAQLGVGVSIFMDSIRGGEGGIEDFAKSLSLINRNLRPLVESFITTGTLSDEQLVKLKALNNAYSILGGVDAAPLGAGSSAEVTNTQLQSLNRIAQKQIEINALRAQATTPGGTDDQLRNNQAVLDAANAAAGEEATKRREAAAAARETSGSAQSAKTSTEGATTALNTQATSTATIATNLERGAKAAERIATAMTSTKGGGATATARIGRYFPKFLADGGFSSRGTDTVPAMLSPGEFVVNARSSKRFFSQLQAINAGKQPVFRQEGGPVTNVGDINVSVSGGNDSSQTGRQVARSIRRELRRGTSQL